MLIIDYKVESVCDASESRLLVKLQNGTTLLLVSSWQVLNRVEIAVNFTLEKELLLPGYQDETFPFFLSYGKETFDLINSKTGKVETLIYGSASNLYGQ